MDKEKKKMLSIKTNENSLFPLKFSTTWKF